MKQLCNMVPCLTRFHLYLPSPALLLLESLLAAFSLSCLLRRYAVGIAQHERQGSVPAPLTVHSLKAIMN